MVKVKKYEFVKKELKFLGHIISRKGIRTDPEKIKKMVNMESPKNLKELRLRLGLFSFYRQYIKGFLGIIKPMYKLTQMENRKYVPFVWKEKRQKAFDKIKKKMTMAPIVTHPDFEKPFILYTDASREDIGAVLHQKDDQGKERIIVCVSRALNQHEKNYPITEKECLAIVWGIEKFWQYLGIKPFSIIMDHVALETVKTADLPRRRRARWLTKLQQYEFTIKHRGGRTIAHVDAMSRLLGESNTTDKILIKALRNEMKRRASQAKFVMVIVHDRDGVRISLRYGEVMTNMWQSLGGKTDRESSMEAALRELEEETGLVAESEDLKFLINDPNYNCDVYTLKVHPNTELDLMEPKKNGEWEKFSFEAYERMAREGRTTPTHITCIEPILHRIKPQPQSPKRKAIKQAQPKGILR